MDDRQLLANDRLLIALLNSDEDETGQAPRDSITYITGGIRDTRRTIGYVRMRGLVLPRDASARSE